MTWRYILPFWYRKKSRHLDGVSFSCDFGKIEHGEIVIFRNYAWDGCSPAWKIGPFWIGTPDGRLNPDGRPQTFYASLVHDFLCQHSRVIPITKERTVDLFRDMLIDGGFSPLRAAIYAAFVSKLGPQDWGADVFQDFENGYNG